MKLETAIMNGKLMVDGTYIYHQNIEWFQAMQVSHDVAAAHALKQAEREADALFNASTRWFRARAWINTRADSLMAQWGFDTGEDA